MKKIVYLLLSFLLVVTLAACGPAFAEAQPGTIPRFDLTRPIVALLALAFEVLLAVVARYVVPPFRRWLDARATKDQQTVLWNLIVRFVDAAEGTFGVKMGKEKMNFVKSSLRSMGYDVDTDYIEAAVKQMNDRLMFQFADGLGVTTGELDEAKDYPGISLEITEWPLELLRDFCAANGIDATGCVTREDYMDAIERGAYAPADSPVPTGRTSDQPPTEGAEDEPSEAPETPVE